MGNQRKRFSVAHLLFLVVIAFLICVCACQKESDQKELVPQSDINTVMEAHTAELMAIPGVVGVAIGETEDKKPCILVLIIEEKDEIINKIPKELEGYPISLLVSGEIKPLTGNK